MNQSTNTVTPSANTVTPSANTVTPSANTVTPSANTVTPSANTVTPSANTVTPSVISDISTLMNIISKLDDNQKVQLGKLLQISQVPKDSLQNQTPIEIQNSMALRQLASKYGFGQSSMITNPYVQPPQSMELQQVNNKLDSLQYSLIDIVRYMQEYTNKYVDMINAKSQEAIQEYVKSITEQGRKIETLKEMQDTAKADEEKKIAEDVAVEESGGILGSFASGAFGALKGAVSKANSMMDSAGENISNLAKKIIPGSPTPSEEEGATPEPPEITGAPATNTPPPPPPPVSVPATNTAAPATNTAAPATNTAVPATNTAVPVVAPVVVPVVKNVVARRNNNNTQKANNKKGKLDVLSDDIKSLNAAATPTPAPAFSNNKTKQSGGGKRKKTRKLKKLKM
jgi:hypothetical protein